jgi:hypothetical protein
MPKVQTPKLVNRGPAGLLHREGDKLVNRGPAGLLTRLDHSNGEESKKVDETRQIVKPGKKNNIAEALENLIIDIDSVQPDPMNARLHPDRNMQSIIDSLNLYGQVKPLVVRKETMTVMAGNGTLEAARRSGWTKIAAAIVDMDEIQAAGYGMADNRTAELAKWDFEIVAKLDKLLLEAQQANVGWTDDELEVLRAADWTPPAIGGYGEDGKEVGKESPLLISFTPDQYETVGEAITALLSSMKEDSDRFDQAQCLELICYTWLQYRKVSTP